MDNSARPTFTINHSKHYPVAIVAGGAGFLGSFLCESLLQQNLIVVAIDNLATGKKTYIQHLLKLPNFVFYEHNLNNPLPENLKNADYIFHLAGIEEYLNGVDMTIDTLLVNSVGSQHLLELCKNTNAKFLLMSSSDLYSGAISSKNINKYFGVSERDDKRYAHHEAKRYAEALTTEYFKKFKVDSRIVRVSDVYGPKMDLEAGTIISALIKESVASDTLTVHGDGLKQLFPAFVTDVVAGTNKAMFSKNTQGKIYTLEDTNPITAINFAYELQKQSEKKLHIVFAPELEEINFQHHKTETTQAKQELGWEPHIELGEGIKKTLDWFNTQGKITKESTFPQLEQQLEKIEKPKKQEKINKQTNGLKISFPTPNLTSLFSKVKIPNPFTFFSKKKRIPLFLSLIIIFTLLLYPLVNLGFNSWYGYFNLTNAKSQFEKGNLDLVVSSTMKAEYSFQAASKQTKELHWLLTMIGLREKAEDYEKLFSAGEYSSTSVKYLGYAGILGKELFNNPELNTQKTTDTINLTKLNLDSSYENISKAEAASKLTNPTKYPKFLNEKITNAKKNIPKLKNLIDKTRSLTQVLPELIGLNGKRTYLFLFQNNNELRATGGFIGSYGLFTFEDGKLKDWKVDDVYTADGQLKGYVEPPVKLKQFLKELSQNPNSSNPSWSLRDSNWDPDFSTSAQTAEWFLSKELGISVDGVIAIDLKPLQDLIEETGGISLPDNKITVDKDNLFLEIEKHQQSFFPGSTKKKDFLYELMFQTLLKATAKDGNFQTNIIRIIDKNVSEKHILAYFHDHSLNLLAEKLNIDGKIKNQSADSIFVVDSNVGANKANQHVKKTINSKIDLNQTRESTHSLQIKYENTQIQKQSLKDSFDYKNYLRVYLPQKTIIENVQVGGVNLFPNQIDISTSSGKLVVGILVNVPYKTKESVLINYKVTPQQEETSSLYQYELQIQKQPGTINDTLNIEINLPPGLKIKKLEPTTVVKNKTIYYNTPLDTDKLLQVILQKE